MAELTRPGLTIAPGERGLVRVFSLNADEEEARRLADPAALQALLGAQRFDADQADLFALADLDEMPLARYLAEGHDIDADQLRAQAAALEAAGPYVLVVRSRAFGGQAMTLLPSPELRLVASFAERGVDWSGKPIETASARRTSTVRTAPREDRARARRIGGTIFALFILLLGLILWVAM